MLSIQDDDDLSYFTYSKRIHQMVLDENEKNESLLAILAESKEVLLNIGKSISPLFSNGNLQKVSI